MTHTLNVKKTRCLSRIEYLVSELRKETANLDRLMADEYEWETLVALWEASEDAR